MTKRIRCFVALNLPDSIKKELLRIQNELKEKNLCTGSFTDEKNLHLTLKFFGSISPESVEKIRKALKRVSMKSCSVSLGKCGVFTEEFVRIIWTSLDGADVLQTAIDKAVVDLFPAENQFMGHITLARPKSVPDREALIAAVKNVFVNKILARAVSFSLMKSTLTPEGSVHEVIQEYPLTEL